ncbi:MAG: type I-E CRISPR-associated protein Cse1/CasA [Propioniciclava sp.]
MSDTNLLTMSWGSVVAADGVATEMGLCDLFARAPDLRRLNGDLPTQDAAVLRFLLAIVLLAVADEQRDVRQAVADWTAWWNDWSRLNGLVQSYLHEHADEFELFDPDHPFLQAAGLEPQGQLAPGVGRLVPDLGHWFSTRQGPDADVLAPAEAARWLLHAQAFDAAGIKTGIDGDPTAKNGKAFPTGFPAWAGNLGVVIVVGQTLAETLLLNLPLRDHPNETRAGWARHQPLFRRDSQTPAGPGELMVWPNRRILMRRDGDGQIRRVQISYGDTLTPQNMRQLEPMSAWRLSKAQSAKAKKPIMMPVTHDVARQVWRGLNALLADRDGRPATLNWLDLLRQRGHLDPALPITLSAVGIEYGPQNGVIASMIDDSLSAELIALTDPGLTELAARCAENARPVVGALTHFGHLLAEASGTDSDQARDRAATRGYAALDPVFRSWLGALHDPTQLGAYEVAWQQGTRGVALAEGRRMFDAAGQAAARGRKVDGKLVSSSSAWSWFEHKITTLTPLASQQTDVPPPDTSSTEENS